MPNAALNASAWAPLAVPVGIEDVAVRAVAHVSFAVRSAPQLLVNVSQMNSDESFGDIFNGCPERTGYNSDVLSGPMVVRV
jgi:hypothetical protein